MLKKIKEAPEKSAFIIGIALIIVTPLLLFLLSHLFPINSGLMLFIEGIVCFIAILFILSAATQRLKRKEHK